MPTPLREEAEEARLLALAAAISEGAEVDWERVALEVLSDRSRRVVQGLRVIDDLARVHRSEAAASGIEDSFASDQSFPPQHFPPQQLRPQGGFPPSSGGFGAADAPRATATPPPSVPVGKWGPLDLLAEIGAGAFGVVYRAWDARLEREVALKLLSVGPSSLHGAVLLKEARLLARVQHAHVVTVYGAEQIDERIGIWMESLRGRTLDELVRMNGRFGADEAALIGLSLCRALAAVHAAGLVHRDIKARNVMREDGGRIVLMDFGAGSDVGYGARDVGPAGTPLYMAPEVLEGAPPAVAADIYSLGVLLFYLVTQSFPVTGRSKTEIDAAHIRGDRRRLRDVRPDLPDAYVQAVEDALASDPKARHASAGAFEEALANVLGSESPRHKTEDDRPRWRQWVTPLLVGAAATAALFLVQDRREPPSASSARSRFTMQAPARASVEAEAVSPDGRHVAFVAAGRLWVQSFDALEPRALPDTAGANMPFWSPDSQHIGFFSGTKLRRVSLTGDDPRTLCDARRPRGATWGRDGTILFASAFGSLLQRVPADGGEPTPVAVPEQRVAGAEINWPHFLPDGRRFLYTVRVSDPDVAGVYASGADAGSASTRLLDVDSNAVYAAGHLLYVRLGVLMARRFDPVRVEPTGAPGVVAERVDQDPFTDGFAEFSVSSTGVVAYRGGVRPDRQLRWFTRVGVQAGVVGVPGEYRDFALSHDGRRLAFDQLDAHSGRRDIWVQDLDGGSPIRITSNAGDDGAPTWSPDGRAIIYASQRDGTYALYRKSADGGGSEERLLEAQAMPLDWSADDRLAYEVSDQKTGSDLYFIALQALQRPLVFLRTEFMEREGQFSPDGRWMAYSSSESSQRQVYLQRIPSTGRRWTISPGYGREPRWRADGRELFYLGPENMLTAIKIRLQEDMVTLTAPEPLFPVRISGADVRQHYAVSPDGQRILVNTLLEDALPAPLTVILNAIAAP